MPDAPWIDPAKTRILESEPCLSEGLLRRYPKHAERHSARQGSVTATVVLTITFAVTCLTLGRRLVTRLCSYFKDLKLPPEGILGVAVLVAFLALPLPNGSAYTPSSERF